MRRLVLKKSEIIARMKDFPKRKEQFINEIRNA